MANKEVFNKFFRDLEAVKRDLTCIICSELCKNPVILNKCYHILCSEHFNDSLTNCPTCNVDLKGCTTLPDCGLANCVHSIKELCKFYEKLMPTNQTNAEKVNDAANVNTVEGNATLEISKKN